MIEATIQSIVSILKILKKSRNIVQKKHIGIKGYFNVIVES